MIPTPQFTSFDVESALPLQLEPESRPPPRQTLPRQITIAQSNDLNGYEVGGFLHKSSIFSVKPSAVDRRVPTSTDLEPQAAYVPSPEQQLPVLCQPNERSTSTTKFSVNTVGVSTPGSHQISDTSYRENGNQEDQGRPKQRGEDSFYWHSGRSSSDAEEEQDQSGFPTSTPEGDGMGQRSSITISTGLQRQYQGLPIRSTSLSPTTSAMYGASALGFGGPSDWEYFGDYEAEEIDDEELYSRPRLGDSKYVVERSAELPVDSALKIVQPCSEPELKDQDWMQLSKSSSQRRVPARNLREASSQESVVQELRVSGAGNYDTEVKTPSVQGLLTARPASGQAVSLSDTHGQQRPDLDDVIRAWSEAPYIGKVHRVAPAAALHLDTGEEPASIAEALLASTPRERNVGIDVMLEENAPSSPKLPDSMNPLGSNDRELQSSTNFSTNQPNTTLTASSCERQALPLLNQQASATKDVSVNADATVKEKTDYTSESEITIQPVLPTMSSMASSGLTLSTPTNSNINKESFDLKRSPDRGAGSRTHDAPQALGKQTQPNADEKPDGSSQKKNRKMDQQTEQTVVLENSESDNLEGCNSTHEGTKTKLPQKIEGNLSDVSIVTVHSETNERLSREIAPSKQVVAFPETTEEDQSASIPRNSPEEDSEHNIKSRQDRSQGAEKISYSHATSGISQSKDNATWALAKVTPPSLSFEVSLLHHTAPSEVGTTQDPYSDLEPWGKASLNRYAAMLREESRAETNHDKLNIFNVFTSRESRLRVILYGTDDELIIPQKPVRQQHETIQKPDKVGFVKKAVERANSLGLEHSLKALPALPTNRSSVVGIPGNAQVSLIVQHGSTSKGQGIDQKLQPSADSTKSQEESEMPDGQSGSNELQYSPGGRPVVARLLRTDRETDARSLQDAGTGHEKDKAPSSKAPASSGSTDSPSPDGPIVVGLESSGAPKKPAYTPLKYNEGRSEVKNYLANRKSVCRPYATLTQGSLDSASNFGKEENIELKGAPSFITAPTSQYNSLSKAKVDGVIDAIDTNTQRFPGTDVSNNLRRFVKADFDPLLLVLPDSNAVVHVSARILDLRNVIELVADDFSFIHQSVVAWDAKAKKQREENDRQRHARQAESEQKIDLLFDDHEIGYGDIAELETEFKRSEAARRADEDRFEYQTFVSDVFDLVWTRLHYELDQLIPLYDQYSKLMDHTLAGKDMFEGSQEGLALGPTMSSFLALHQKIEIRHQKAFEAVLERDRRLKKTEISPWYTLSNIAKVKQLEKQFEDAEKKAIIEYCQQRNTRANHLMDVLDQNTLRGVGANQDYMEAIMKAVRRIASGRAFASVPETNEPTAGLEEVEKAKAITALLASSSEQVVQTFQVADMLLNSADYEVHVARAKVAKADMATLAKLKEERAKEDQRLMRELEHRLALIREDTRRTNDEIVKLMLFLGVQNGRADSTSVQAEPIDPKHEARIRKALEEAKRRNILKESGEGNA